MRSLRRHIVGSFAACVTLAVGVALGAGPLQGDASAGDVASVDTTALRDRVTSLQADRTFDAAVLEASGGSVLGSALTGASVAVVALPGVGQAVLHGVAHAIGEAGGQVAVTAMVSPRLVDPAQKTYTASVATSAVRGMRDLRSVPTDQPYAQIAALFTRAYLGRGTDLVLDDEAVKIDSELRGAKLVTRRGHLHRRASLVVVLASGAHGTDPVTSASHVIESQLLAALARGSDAVVVATPPTGSASGGLLDAVSRDRSLRSARLSTINVVDGAAAQISTIYALAAVAHGTTGEYGVTGSTVRLPPGLSAGGR